MSDTESIPQAEDAREDVCKAAVQFQLGSMEVTTSCIIVEEEHGARHANFDFSESSRKERVEIRFAWEGEYTDVRPEWAKEILDHD